MAKRDPRKAFEDQKRLHENRPPTDPEAIKEASQRGDLWRAISFSVVVGPTELAITFAIENETPKIVSLNPDVVLNLAINLLKAGNQQHWFEVDMHAVAPPKSH